MFIKVGELTYELFTKLRTAIALEKMFKLTTNQIFAKIEEATITELVDMLSIAAQKTETEAKDFKKELIDSWDYLDLQLAVQELLVKLMFTGTPEQIEKKLAKYPSSDQQKNAIRELLEIPIPETSPKAPMESTGEI